MSRPKDFEAWLRRKEKQILICQHAWILKRFGQDAADKANYGQGVDYVLNPPTCIVETKVYGKGRLVCRSEFGGHIDYDFSGW
jgi:hypothetical protein